MAQTIGIVRGGLVINKIFINSNQSANDVEVDTKYTAIVTDKHVK